MLTHLFLSAAALEILLVIGNAKTYFAYLWILSEDVCVVVCSRYFELPKSLEAQLLAHPLSLVKLCYFLMDSLKEQGRAVKPMICIATIPGPANMALVVGVSHRPRLGAANGNKFGLIFRAIAEKLGSNYSHDAFESSWIHLAAADVTRFMHELQTSLAGYSSL